MPISETVAVLAQEIEEQLPDLSACQLKLLAVLKEMPKYSAEGRLDLWETDYTNAINDGEENTHNVLMIDLIFELGARNLYGAFDASGTQRFYQEVLLKQFIHKGFSVSENLDVSGW
jgi:hypothetical protein